MNQDIIDATRALESCGEESRMVHHDHLRAALAEVGRLTSAIASAREDGHRAAVEETAILSIHKAVAAERAACVSAIRGAAARAHSIGGEGYGVLDFLADAIERGEHRP